MISKNFSKSGKSCRVTFRVPVEDLKAENISILGDFNGWDPEANPLKLRKNGTFSTTLSLDVGTQYKFRYLLDGDRWLNDDEADREALNKFGSRDAVLEL